jgi:hypothetical protein
VELKDVTYSGLGEADASGALKDFEVAREMVTEVDEPRVVEDSLLKVQTISETVVVASGGVESSALPDTSTHVCASATCQQTLLIFFVVGRTIRFLAFSCTGGTSQREIKLASLFCD